MVTDNQKKTSVKDECKKKGIPYCCYMDAPCDYGGGNPRDCSDCNVVRYIEQMAMEEEARAEQPMVCAYCGCELVNDEPHDHTDDSPHIDPGLLPRGDY